MPHTTRMPRDQRRAQLLTLATELFTQRGFQATSMDDIAAAAGVTKPVLYQHFSSKEDLYSVVVETTGERLLAAVEALADAPGDTAARIQRAMTSFYELVRTDNTLRLFTGHEVVSPAVQQRVSEILDEMSVRASHVLSDSRTFDPEQARVIGRALIAIAQASASAMDQAQDEQRRAAIAADITTLVVHGLTGFAPLENPRVAGEVTAGSKTR